MGTGKTFCRAETCFEEMNVRRHNVLFHHLNQWLPVQRLVWFKCGDSFDGVGLCPRILVPLM